MAASLSQESVVRDQDPLVREDLGDGGAQRHLKIGGANPRRPSRGRQVRDDAAVKAALAGYVDFTRPGVLDAMKTKWLNDAVDSKIAAVGQANQGFVDFTKPGVADWAREKAATESVFNENPVTDIGRAALSVILDHFPDFKVDRIVERDEKHRSDYWLSGPDYCGGFDTTSLSILAYYILNDPDVVQPGRTPRDEMIRHYLDQGRHYDVRPRYRAFGYSRWYGRRF